MFKTAIQLETVCSYDIEYERLQKVCSASALRYTNDVSG